MTRWLDYFFNVWMFKSLKNCYLLFAKVGWKFCLILNKPSKDCSSFRNWPIMKRYSEL